MYLPPRAFYNVFSPRCQCSYRIEELYQVVLDMKQRNAIESNTTYPFGEGKNQILKNLEEGSAVVISAANMYQTAVTL